MKTIPKSFLFFGDVLNLKKSSYTLFDEYLLKRPTNKQIKFYKNYIDNIAKVLTFNKINRFEYIQVPAKAPFPGGHNYKPLDKKNWNYSIIEYSTSNPDWKLYSALALCELDLTILMEVKYSLGFRDSGGNFTSIISKRELEAIHFLFDSNLFNTNEKQVKLKDITEIRHLYDSLVKFERKKNDYDFIFKALEDFLKLKEISEQSPFKLLSYFSILEHLLTKTKQGSSPDDSINSQLKKKISIIDNKLKKRIDIARFFIGQNSLNIETVIAKLYRYRNDIAHGNKINFEKKLKILKNDRQNILPFIHHLLKKVLAKAVAEPQFFNNLKES